MDNYARFYASLNALPYSGDREEFKKDIVAQFTWNRTTSLKEMTKEEYNNCCAALEKMSGRKDRIKKERSRVLHLMQRLGVNTSDWPTVDNFCMNARIAGKRFCRLGLEELVGLQKKLRAIERNGGLKARGGGASEEPRTEPNGGATRRTEQAEAAKQSRTRPIMMYIPIPTGDA